ncbi:P1 family peptidase [Gephyromycinifex aptenodytis]|uniref:P1 family peptidase n=1 Tax=Gephyromycinifex aptenodytis TaxID=2716227 RepID=UPI001447704C|nr:P1 family peptidase [Gephyromycinifex aptenodytis]
MTAQRPGPGPTNSLLDVAGLRLGQATRADPPHLSGVSVVLAGEQGVVAGVDVRGGGPGTRETDLLDPRNVVERVHAIALCGGSAFGLAAADGVMQGLYTDGIGLPMGGPGEVVPLVPAAVIFDLGRGGDFAARPDAATGAQAYAAAKAGGPVEQGCVGAGTGAKAGGLKGGVGTASVVLPGGAAIGALIVCNSLGEVITPQGTFHAQRYLLPADAPALRAPDEQDLAQAAAAARTAAPMPVGRPGLATTIGVVATDLSLTKAQCAKLAGVGHDGIARAVDPAHTMLDGDTLFGLATGQGEVPDLALFHEVLTHAPRVVSRAIVRAVLAATSTTTSAGTWRSYREAFPSAFAEPSGDASPDRGPHE